MSRGRKIALLLTLWLAMGLSGSTVPLGGCSSPVEAVIPSSDVDRQCNDTMMCPMGLLCVRLFVQKRLGDGGLVPVNNFTCHAPCNDDPDCSMGYRCFLTLADPMKKVCVQEDVIKNLQHMDGGT